ncbi:U2 snRNP-associated SURP motif-containing protein isoform X2 [Phlebotomus argentipes]|uniref:U2 snRNP-associated SURP motif-containing protein isoform X2 n=1 Tax=Phlebotomus argentipes TaxID=94469 RepID=UPI002892DEEC|nr:U2 snRNP-associated SURP motif-containing protein isoform X2 [Phlebotomus argentipes]
MKKINQHKLQAFAVGAMGQRGLSRKEQEEQKKREEEQAAAHAFQEFVETFQEAPSTLSKVWVKAGTYDAGSRKEDHRERGKLYKPMSKLAEEKSSTEKASEYAMHLAGESKNQENRLKKKSQEKKKSNLELFKEELRMIQEEREERHKYKNVARSMLTHLDSEPGVKENDVGSFDNGDPNTTNLYLGNLSPKITEQQLMELFGKYGPLASIKIMWPRSEEEKNRGRNCGFVAYMSRRDAERALKCLNGCDVMGYEMKLGWGKSVPILNHPIYIPPALVEYSMPPPPSGLPFNAQTAGDPVPERVPSAEYMNSADAKAELDSVLRESVVKVVIPTDRTLLALIHRMIEFVVREGPLFEAMIMNREIENPMFRFLFENDSPAHIYYRWKLFSLLQGDTPSEWREREFRMFVGGSVWKPPPLNFYTQGMPDELVPEDANSESNKGALSTAQRDRLEDLIRHLTPERTKIGDAMIFCIEHADAADEICECIAESMANSETLVHKKIARLYLISDILHNCSVKVQNASFFRKAMERNLLDIFKELNTAYMGVESRLKAEGFKVRVLQVCRTWEEWVVYPRDFLLKLRNTFLGQIEEVVEELDGAPLSGDEKDDEDLDGVPLDGAALLKSAMLRGLPDIVASESGSRSAMDRNSHDSDMDDDIDGVPLDEDIDGIPLGSAFGKGAAGGAFVPSKWETVDPEQIEAQAITTSKWDKLNPVTPDPPRIGGDSDDSNDDALSLGTSESARDYDEERRTRLREIELKILQYQDELESGKRTLKTGWTLSQQLEHFRRKLMKKSLRDPRGQDNSDSASEKYSSSSREKKSDRRSLSPPEASHRSRSPYVKKSARDSISPPSSRNLKLKRGRSRSASDSPKRYRDRRYEQSPPRKHRSPSPRSSRSSRDFGREVSPVSSSSARYSSSSTSTKSPPSRHRSDKHKHRHKY